MATDNFVQIGTAIMLTYTGEKRTEPLYTKASLLQESKRTDGAKCSGSVGASQPPTRAACAERGGVSGSISITCHPVKL